MAFPRYESYKSAKSEWLNEVPSHWKLLPGMAVLKENKVRNTGMVEKTVLSLSYGKVIVKSPEKLTGLVPESFETYQVINPNDIIIRPTDLQNDQTSLRTGISKDRGIITSAYICLRPDPAHNQTFIYYLLHAYDLLKVYYGMGSGLRQNLDFKDFKRLELCIPPRNEQDRIANFLDQKIVKIDEAIAKKQRLIELLKEQKAILINQAVTKGLNPAAPMRDSGVAWIGEVPTHWEMSRVGFIGSVGNGSTPNRSVSGYWDSGDIPWLNSSKVNDGVITQADQFVTKRAVRECHLPTVYPNSIVVGITGEGKTRGMAALCSIEATINQHLAFIEVRDKRILPRYLLSYLHGMYNWMRHESSAAGSTKGAITCDDVKKYKLPIPPLNEQEKIIHRIDMCERNIIELIEKSTMAINQMDELKQVVISEAVTGKIKI